MGETEVSESEGELNSYPLHGGEATSINRSVIMVPFGNVRCILASKCTCSELA